MEKSQFGLRAETLKTHFNIFARSGMDRVPAFVLWRPNGPAICEIDGNVIFKEPECHEGFPTYITPSSDDAYLMELYAPSFQLIRRSVQDLSVVEHLKLPETSSKFSCVAASENAQIILVGTGTQLLVFDVDRRLRTVATPDGHTVKNAYFSKDGVYVLLVADNSVALVTVFDMMTCEECKTNDQRIKPLPTMRLRRFSRPFSAGWLSDEVGGMPGLFVGGNSSGVLQVWELAGDRLLRDEKIFDAAVCTVTPLARSRRLLLASEDGDVILVPFRDLALGSNEKAYQKLRLPVTDGKVVSVVPCERELGELRVLITTNRSLILLCRYRGGCFDVQASAQVDGRAFPIPEKGLNLLCSPSGRVQRMVTPHQLRLVQREDGYIAFAPSPAVPLFVPFVPPETLLTSDEYHKTTSDKVSKVLERELERAPRISKIEELRKQAARMRKVAMSLVMESLPSMSVRREPYTPGSQAEHDAVQALNAVAAGLKPPAILANIDPLFSSRWMQDKVPTGTCRTRLDAEIEKVEQAERQAIEESLGMSDQRQTTSSVIKSQSSDDLSDSDVEVSPELRPRSCVHRKESAALRLVRPLNLKARLRTRMLKRFRKPRGQRP